MENKEMQAAPKKGVIRRIIRTLFSFYPVLMPVVLFCILFNAIVSAIPAVFMQNIIAVIEQSYQSGDWEAVAGKILGMAAILAILYAVSLIASFTYCRLLAVITQGSLKKLREKMFNGMQNLPIKYFDTHSHGDIMSYYTNDIDTLRQLISQSMPQLLSSGVMVITVFGIMLYYSLWMSLVIVAGVIIMLRVIKKVGGNSAKYFIRQQESIGKVEGYIEEMMNGQKVVKVFCHEEESKADFDALNEELFEVSERANKYANTLGPILNNIGNLLYVAVTLAGGLFLMLKVPNVSISGLPFAISIVVPFLNMTKQFAGNINQVSQQVNAVVMGMAGASRIFDLIDEEPEADEGYVTLVRAKEEDGVIRECKERTGMWAWKHPHREEGTVTYTKLTGDVRFFDVDFAYEEGKTVLHNVTLYAKPGQKVAFVGSTGAGKTTITNLINRFYDIQGGSITVDGVDVRRMHRKELRENIAMVLQDTHLFTGTVRENIRYGRLDATDEEVVEAAKTASAHSFIMRLPDGYDTMLEGDGANLSQGQRQLLNIARAAVSKAPILILDEATSSVDTRTEKHIEHGMDRLMADRTTFVIAHRLSTVRNANAIMVLEHGQIIERGDHEDLLAQKGRYFELYTGMKELE